MSFANDGVSLVNPLQSRDKSTAAMGSINLLVEAAAVLFSVVNRLNRVESSFRSEELLEALTEEMRIFENKISTRYNTNFMLMVRSVVCAFIDEMVAKSEWGSKNKWNADMLSRVFVADNGGGTKNFFVILEQAVQEPVLHLDLLELMYLCLHFGFEGKYKGSKKINSALTETSNDLYRLLHKYRNQIPEDLLIAPIQNETVIAAPSRKSRYFWRGLTVGLVITALASGAIYWYLDAKLQHAAGVVYKNFERPL